MKWWNSVFYALLVYSSVFLSQEFQTNNNNRGRYANCRCCCTKWLHDENWMEATDKMKLIIFTILIIKGENEWKKRMMRIRAVSRSSRVWVQAVKYKSSHCEKLLRPKLKSDFFVVFILDVRVICVSFVGNSCFYVTIAMRLSFKRGHFLMTGILIETHRQSTTTNQTQRKKMQFMARGNFRFSCRQVIFCVRYLSALL